MFKRKLLKRALPLLLSVSMVLGSMPTTALAAEYDESEVVEETVFEESETADEETISSEDAPESTGGGYQEEAKTAAETETVAETETAIQTEVATEKTADTAELNADAQPSLDTEIVIDESRLKNYLNEYFKYDEDTKTVMAKYDEAQSDVFGSVRADIENKNYGIVSVKVDGQAIDLDENIPEGNISFKWQKKSGESYADMPGETPSEPNDYKLVVSLNAIDGVCQADTAELDFTITKRQLSIDVDDIVVSVEPGTKVQDFVADLTKNYVLQKESRTWDEDSASDVMSETAKGVYIASITADVYELNGESDAALSADSVLMKDCDYVVKVNAVLSESMQSSFELVGEGTVNIKIDDLIGTKVKVEQKDAGAVISKVYDGTAVSYETDVKDKVTVSIVVTDKDGDESKDTVIEGAQPTLVWCDADKKELEASSTEENADTAPVEAGTYYLDFRYIPAEGKENIYKESTENYIKVVIEPAPLTLKPAALEEGKYFTGMTEADVLRDVDYTLSDASGADFTFDRDTFWGVSYDNPIGAQQEYKPVFKLIRAEKDKDGSAKKDKDGNVIWSDNGSNNKLDASKYLYRVVFTGKKAVYSANGSVIDSRDVNGGDVNTADKDHCIVTSAKALADNYVDVPVTDGKATNIDVSAILGVEGVKATEDFNDLYKPARFASKVYNKEGLYENRAAYKLAKVTDADGKDVASNYDDTITYSWYRIDSKTAVYDEETGKQTGWEANRTTALSNNSIPYSAGDYKLVISFSDIPNGYAPSSKTLYYRIEKQLLVVSPTSIPTAYKGDVISTYINNLYYEEEHNIYLVPNNEYSEAVKTEANLFTDWEQVRREYWNEYDGNCYDLNWYVERLERNDDKTPKKDEDGNNIYTRLSENDSFKLLDENYYRLGVEMVCSNSSNYTNYQVVYKADAEKQDFGSENKYYNDYVNITVKEMGSIALEIEVDETKLASIAKDYDAQPFYATREEAEADILKAITIKKKATGEVLSESDPAPKLYADLHDDEIDYYIDLDRMINAGTYTLQIGILSDETYIGCEADKEIKYTIKPLELHAKAHAYDDIVAGTYVYGSSAENDGVVYDGKLMEIAEYEKIPEADQPAFAYGTRMYPYVDDYGELQYGYYDGYAAYFDTDTNPDGWIWGTVRKAGQSGSYSGYIRYNTDYTIQLNGTLAYPYSRNYKVTYERTPFKAAFRGASTVLDLNNNETIPYQWNLEELSTTITPMQGIPYISGRTVENSRGEETELDGNYFEFKIEAPKEFQENYKNYNKYFKNFVYQNSIEKDAKGYVTGTDFSDGRISVLIPVDKNDEEKVKTFKIVWENGYTEKYSIDFTNAVLLDDLTKAVAPKSLAFNGVNTKMVVGEEQQLDVKIKKAQISDIIYLEYRVKDNKDVLSVTNDDDKQTAGYVTALKPGTATVEAMPVRMVNGEKKDIPGAKPATVKISVSDVTAPAVKSLTAIDVSADLTYVKPSDGYRREIYVLEGGKITEQTFKDKIASMKNGKWNGIFAVAPKYCAEETIDNAKSRLTTVELTGLKADTEYTVYIRNVSGVRTLQDGTLAVASAKGVLKGFKTTKSQVKKLNAYFEKPIAGTDPVEMEDVDYKQIPLSQKTEQLYVSGKFLEKPETASADKTDYIWYALPLDTKTHKEYVAPKLTYWLSPDYEGRDKEGIEDVKDYTCVAGRYYRKTSIATIDKKGKITLKGVGTVYAHVYDPATKEHAVAELDIFANADKITGKGGKLAVGQRVYLSSLLTYYEGKATLLGYEKQDLSIAAETLKKINDEGNFSIVPTGYGDYFITALKPKMSCEFTVTDKLVALLQGTSDATIKLQSAPIEAVKNMKITDIADDRFVINFAYSILADNETYYTDRHVQFRIDITDARGSVVDSVVVDRYDFDSKNISDFNENIWDRVSYYDAKKKLISYKLPYESDKIVRLSSYKVSIKPIYGDDLSAKPAVKAVKTTNFPASYTSLSKDEFGGANISVAGIAGSTNNNNNYWIDLSSRPYLTSGNTYTLKLEDEFDIARDRATDSLTWKSLDTKVAAVKANAGTYTASLNAVKAGVTVIEVTSKLTKKVIARYPVFVKAVGNAKDDYYGDYEYIGEYPYEFDPFYNSNIEVLTEANPVRVTEEDLANVTIFDAWLREHRSENYKWVKFTAPAFGKYDFSVKGEGRIEEVISANGGKANAYTSSYSRTIFEGQTYYFKVSGTFIMTVTGTKAGSLLTTTDAVEINSESRQYIQFRATEDNYYTFYTRDGSTNGIYNIGRMNDKTQSFETVSGVSVSYKDGVTRKSVGLSAGDVIYLEMISGTYKLYAEKREAVALSGSAAQNLNIKSDGEQWYTFTAPAAGEYTFKSTGATTAINADYYEDITKANGNVNAADHYGTDAKDFTYTIQLEEKQKVAFKIYADKEQITDPNAVVAASISVTAEVPDTIEVGGTKPLAVPEGGVKWLSVKLTEAGRYTFSAAATEAGASYGIYLDYYKNALDNYIFISNDEIIVSDKYTADAETGDTIYVKVETGKTGTDADTPATANVNVSLTKASATALSAGTPSPLTVENGKEYWYTFTAPSYGIYTFRSVVTENTENETHRLRASKYKSMEMKWDDGTLSASNYDFNTSYTLKAGEEVVLKVYSSSDVFAADGTTAVTTSAQIRVDQRTAEAFTVETPANVSLAKGDIKWYSFTALQSGTYTFTKKMTAGLASVSLHGTLDGTGDVNEVGSNGVNRTMDENETVYFKVTQDGEDAAALTITAYTPVIETLSDAPVSVTSAEAKYYVYTAAKKGRYAISYTVNPAEADVTVKYGMGSLDNADDNTVNNGYEELDYVAAGTKIYFKVSTTSEAAVSVSLKAEQVVPAELAAGAAVPITVAPNKNVWYSFTALEAGRYAFVKTDAENNSTDMTFYKDIVNTSRIVENDLSGNYMKPGETIYIKLSTTASEPQTTSFKAEKITIVPITEAATSVTMKPGETKYYSFTAAKKGFYQINAVKTVQPETGDAYTTTPDAYISDYYFNTDNESFWYDWGEPLDLENTDVVTFAITLSSSYQEETFSLSCKNMDDELIWLEADQPKSLTIKEGEKKWVAYEVPEDGLFAFSTSDVPARVTPIADKAYEGGFYYLEKGEAADVIELGISYEYDSDITVEDPESATFNVKVSRVNPQELTLDAPVSATVAKYERKWVKFTAPEDGRYIFNAQKEGVDLYGETYYYIDGEVLGDFGYGLLDEVIMEKGEEIALAVYYDEGTDASVSFNISAQKVVPKAVVGGAINDTFQPNQSQWYEYTAELTGTYRLSVENTDLITRIYKNITDSDSNYTGVYTNPVSASLMAGDKLYIYIENTSSADPVAAQFKIGFVEGPTAFSVGEAAEVSFAENLNIKWMAFTPEEDGFYNFSISGSSYFYTRYATRLSGVNNNKFDTSVTSNSSYSYGSSITIRDRLIAGGDTVYLCVYANSAIDGITVTVAKDTEKAARVERLNMGVLRAYIDKGSDNAVYYAFYAPEQGSYRISFATAKSDSGEEAERYTVRQYTNPLNGIGSSSGYSVTGTSIFSISAAANQLIYFYVEKTSGESEKELTITISQEK